MKNPNLTKFSAPKQIFEKKRPKKAFLALFFGKFRPKKSRFFGARFPLKISIDWRQRVRKSEARQKRKDVSFEQALSAFLKSIS